MINKTTAVQSIDSFNETIDTVKNIKNFDEAVSLLNNCRDNIHQLQSLIQQMKQEEHDLTQDVYNKFKGKNYVKTIKF